MDPLKYFSKIRLCKNSLGGDMHSHERLLVEDLYCRYGLWIQRHWYILVKAVYCRVTAVSLLWCILCRLSNWCTETVCTTPAKREYPAGLEVGPGALGRRRSTPWLAWSILGLLFTASVCVITEFCRLIKVWWANRAVVEWRLQLLLTYFLYAGTWGCHISCMT